jgi:hypothetical protein
MMAIGVMFSVIVNLGLPPAVANRVFSAFGRALQALLGTGGLLR